MSLGDLTEVSSERATEEKASFSDRAMSCSLDVNSFLQRKFVRGKYNCFDMARDVWKILTGVDLGPQTPKNLADYNGRAEYVAGFLERLDKPATPCLVLFQSPRVEPHIGVYYKGRVLHLNQKGAYYMPLDHVSAGYRTVSFYR